MKPSLPEPPAPKELARHALAECLEDIQLARIELEVRLAYAETFRALARGTTIPRKGVGNHRRKSKQKAPDLYPLIVKRLGEAASLEVSLIALRQNERSLVAEWEAGS